METFVIAGISYDIDGNQYIFLNTWSGQMVFFFQSKVKPVHETDPYFIRFFYFLH